MNSCKRSGKISLNPFANPEISSGYEDWYLTIGRWVDRQEKALLQSSLAGFPQARTILEAGCGTGHFTRWFVELGLRAAGLDRSRPMLDEAVVRLSGPAGAHPGRFERREPPGTAVHTRRRAGLGSRQVLYSA